MLVSPQFPGAFSFANELLGPLTGARTGGAAEFGHPLAHPRGRFVFLPKVFAGWRWTRRCPGHLQQPCRRARRGGEPKFERPVGRCEQGARKPASVASRCKAQIKSNSWADGLLRPPHRQMSGASMSPFLLTRPRDLLSEFSGPPGVLGGLESRCVLLAPQPDPRFPPGGGVPPQPLQGCPQVEGKYEHLNVF